MTRMKLLDCTLRDGGYINNWQFGNENIKGIIRNLEDAKIDIIECGFIRNGQSDPDTSVFASMNEVRDCINPKKPGSLYAIMIEQHNHVDDLIPDYDATTADIIRITFRKSEWEEAKKTVQRLMRKGYKICVQPVGTASYDDHSLLNLIKDVNALKPYAFYLVDTLGVIYQHDMRRFFHLIDNKLSKDIKIGFHSHNNLQMSFANAQELIRLAAKREIIIDSSCYGMGRGVGNLATELLADYVNNNIEQRYSLIPILNVVDKYLMPIYAQQRWGYDLPYFLSATAKAHPNYAAYLMKKETLGIESVEKLLRLIPQEARSEYNASIIEKLYLTYQECNVDDSDAIECLAKKINDKKILLLGPGASISNEKEKIDDLIERETPFIITTNFLSDIYNADAAFISNEKRCLSILNNIDKNCMVLVTSNLKKMICEDVSVFNYTSLLGEGDAADNAGAMILRLLKKIGIPKLYFAGFDGFEVDASMNYFDSRYKTSMDYDTAMKKNKDIAKQLLLALSELEYEVLTKTKYEI